MGCLRPLHVGEVAKMSHFRESRQYRHCHARISNAHAQGSAHATLFTSQELRLERAVSSLQPFMCWQSTLCVVFWGRGWGWLGLTRACTDSWCSCTQARKSVATKHFQVLMRGRASRGYLVWRRLLSAHTDNNTQTWANLSFFCHRHGAHMHRWCGDLGVCVHSH